MHEAPGTAEGSCFFILLSHFSITVDTIHWWILRVFYHVLLSCQYLFDGMYFFPFHQQFIGKIFIAKAMHIRNSITYKFISFRIIKKASASSYFICKTIPKDLFHLPLLSGEVGRETFSVP